MLRVVLSYMQVRIQKVAFMKDVSFYLGAMVLITAIIADGKVGHNTATQHSALDHALVGILALISSTALHIRPAAVAKHIKMQTVPSGLVWACGLS